MLQSNSGTLTLRDPHQCCGFYAEDLGAWGNVGVHLKGFRDGVWMIIIEVKTVKR